eukprot:222056_1
MSRKGKKSKRPKDINAPKRPQSSYFLFMNERRPILRKKHSGKSMTDVSKLISVEWKKIDDKKKYVEKAAKLKEIYKGDLEEYQGTKNYRNFQKRLKKWKEEQKQQSDSDDNKSRKTRKTRSKKSKHISSDEESSQEESTNESESQSQSQSDESQSDESQAQSDSNSDDNSSASSDDDSDYANNKKK